MNISVVSVFEGKSLIGTSTTHETDEVLITDTSGLFLYKTIEQHNVWSQTFKPGRDTPFTSPVVLDSQNNICYGIKNKSLSRWSSNNPKESNNSTLLDETVFKVFPIQFSNSSNFNVGVIFNDGKISIYDGTSLSLLVSNTTLVSSKRTLYWCKIFHARDSPSTFQIAFIFQQPTKPKDLSWYILSLSKNQQGDKLSINLQYSGLIPPKTDSSAQLLEGYLDVYTKELTLLWADGFLETYQIVFDSLGKKERTIANKIISHQLKIYDMKNVSMLGGYKDGIIILIGIHLEKNLYFLTAWSTNFGTLQASFALETVSISNQLVHLSSSIDRSYIIVGFSKTVVVLPCYIPSNSLLSSLGKMKETESITSIQSPNIPPAMNLSMLLYECFHTNSAELELTGVSPDDKLWTRVSQMDLDEEVRLQLTKPGIQKEEWHSIWQTFITKKLESKKKKTPLKFSHEFVHSIVDVCLQKANLYWEPIKVFVNNSTLSFQTVPNLLPLIIEHKNFELLSECLQNFNDISSKDLINVLKFLLPFPVKDTKSIQIISLLLNQPLAISFMQQYMKTLTAQEVQKLLEVLSYFLQLFTEGKEKEVLSPPPTIQKLLNFISVFLDSHFTTLVLTKASHTILKDLQQMIKENISFCEQIEPLSGMLRQLKQGKSLPTDDEGVYTIEVLHL